MKHTARSGLSLVIVDRRFVAALDWHDSKAAFTLVLSNIGWAHAGPAMLAAFLASTVEFVEALTVILAIGSLRGCRDTLLGTGVALCVLLALIVLFGQALASIPPGIIQVLVGALLLPLGLRWLRKVTLRSVGAIALRDEAAAFGRQVETMRGQVASMVGWDRLAFAGAFQITMLEGTELVFIVIAIAAGGVGLLAPVSAAAVAALLLVSVLGVAVRRPFARVPENTLKFAVSVLLSGFGAFWFSEGIGVTRPGGDLAILALVAGFLAAFLLARALCRVRLVSQTLPSDRNVP